MAKKTKNTNTTLNKAKSAKNDEFYTRYEDIEREVNNYTLNSRVNYFENKIVYCNCDDPTWSNFFWFFANKFEILGIKALNCTHYKEGTDLLCNTSEFRNGRRKNPALCGTGRLSINR